MPDNRIVFHYNRKHNEDQTIPPWIVKTRGMTYQVHHFTSEVGFTTKETPDNPSTKGSLQLRGFLTLKHEDGITSAMITEKEPE